MNKQPLTGFSRLLAAWKNSLAGLKTIWQNEAAFRLETYIAVVGIPLAFVVADDLFQSAVLIAALLLVLLVEIINSAIEATIDRIGPERHELSKAAKDLGSLAVLVSCVIAGVLWLAVILST